MAVELLKLGIFGKIEFLELIVVDQQFPEGGECGKIDLLKLVLAETEAFDLVLCRKDDLLETAVVNRNLLKDPCLAEVELLYFIILEPEDGHIGKELNAAEILDDLIFGILGIIHEAYRIRDLEAFLNVIPEVGIGEVGFDAYGSGRRRGNADLDLADVAGRLKIIRCHGISREHDLLKSAVAADIK